MLKKIKKELKKYSSTERKKANEKFFKLGKGECGEGDIFVGVSVPDLRKIAKQFSAEVFSQIQKNDFELLENLIQSKIHEERMLTLFFLVNNFTRYPVSSDLKNKKRILRFYLKNKDFVNNWDLVDVSAHKILGQSILEGLEKKEILEKLAKSKNLWHRRIAIISTFAFIRKNQFSETFRISKILLKDEEDLIQKAVGWMLREVWKREEGGVQKRSHCEEFLCFNYQKITRTTLRYAIEKMPKEKRQKLLKGENLDGNNFAISAPRARGLSS